MMNNGYGMALIAAATALGFGLVGGNGQHRRREFTLDEEEAQSVHRMLNRARARRRMMERAEITERELQAAREAAKAEAARPKSRQERRALARENAKDPYRWDRKRRRP